MQNSFWQQLDKPIIGLSPMDGITDQPFRYITQKYGNPDVIYTEFTNVEGLCHGATQLLDQLIYDNSQRPIVAQIYGKTPECFRQVAVLVCQMGFDGIDINMGCPAKTVANNGSGAALIQTPKLAQQIIAETKAGVQDYLNGKRIKDCPDLNQDIEDRAQNILQRTEVDRYGVLKRASRGKASVGEVQNGALAGKLKTIPVSVKTRIGYDKPIVEDWIPYLLETNPAAIALHGRTLRQAYTGLADWEQIQKAATLIHQTDTLILGNGDIKSYDQALQYSTKYEIDGVLIGRASFGHPTVFNKKAHNSQLTAISSKIALEHAQIYEQTFQNQERYSFLPMRKHLGWYIKGFENAKQVRIKLMQVNSSDEVKEVFREFGLIQN